MQTLRLFFDVARCHSFSQAALSHGITQSAASQRISQLEKRLGVTLIDRSVRPLGLTEAGKVYLAGIDDILQRYDRLEQLVMPRPAGAVRAAGTPGVSGLVRVSAIYSSGIDLLRKVREAFIAELPGVAVQITYDKPDDVHQAVRDGGADVGILSYPERFKRVGVLPLREEVMVVVGPPGHPLASQATVRAAQLTDHEMVAFDLDLPVGRRLAAYLRDNGAVPVTAHRFDNIDTLKSAVAETGRFAILPRRTVRREVEAGTLAMAELLPRLTRPLGIIFRRPSTATAEANPGNPLASLDPASARFVNYLIQYAGQHNDLSIDANLAPPLAAGARGASPAAK